MTEDEAIDMYFDECQSDYGYDITENEELMSTLLDGFEDWLDVNGIILVE